MERTVVVEVKHPEGDGSVLRRNDSTWLPIYAASRHMIPGDFLSVQVAEGTPCILRGLVSWTAVRHVDTVLVLHCVRYLCGLVVRTVLIGLPCRNWTASW